ncbi:MAG: SRPBCC family protein [Acidimicrobiia bacterium]|nr:SRPBCC family protein [Acidimicrobiia bacterium]NNC76023.1 SRPBCC family protein [Acidimicrobiia bacterium]
MKVSVDIPAPPSAVWADIADVGSHVEWMADAEEIRFLSEQHSGVGTRMEVLTRVGPLSTTDIMEFTAWEPPHRMAIRHEGLVTGEGEFLLEEIPEGTRFIWSERLTFPWYAGGPATALAATPVLAAIWRRNLKRLAARF